MVLEGLHPFYDQRVADLLDFKIYLDISDEVKFAWKIQRDMKERGHSLESIKASIEARKPDFDAYIDPQKKAADVIIQVRAPPAATLPLPVQAPWRALLRVRSVCSWACGDGHRCWHVQDSQDWHLAICAHCLLCKYRRQVAQRS